MSDFKPTFLGSVLKVIACTPNRNEDIQAYEQGVIAPSRELRKLADSIGDKKPDTAQVNDVLQTLKSILEVKQVDKQEQDERLQEVIELHQLASDLDTI